MASRLGDRSVEPSIKTKGRGRRERERDRERPVLWIFIERGVMVVGLRSSLSGGGSCYVSPKLHRTTASANKPGPHGRVGRPHWDPSALALLPLRLCLPLTLHPIAGRAWSGCTRAVPRWPVSASRWDFNVEPLQAGNLRPYGEYPPTATMSRSLFQDRD